MDWLIYFILPIIVINTLMLIRLFYQICGINACVTHLMIRQKYSASVISGVGGTGGSGTFTTTLNVYKGKLEHPEYNNHQRCQ